MSEMQTVARRHAAQRPTVCTSPAGPLQRLAGRRRARDGLGRTLDRSWRVSAPWLKCVPPAPGLGAAWAHLRRVFQRLAGLKLTPGGRASTLELASPVLLPGRQCGSWRPRLIAAWARSPRLKALPLCLVLCCGAACAQALQLPPQPAADFSPRAGARLPLDVVMRDENGAAIRLGTVFGRSPVVLVPGYYTCPNLCSTLFEGVLQALALSGMEQGAYRLVGFSIDPRDGAAAAAAKRAAYAVLLPGGAASVRMLTGDAPALARIEAALGYRAVRDGAGLAHAAGFVVADADGRVTRYFPGVRFDPAQLRQAVTAARGGAGGQGSFGERLLLLCSHYNPASGLHTDAALAAVRAGVLLSLAGLGAWLWRRYRLAPCPAPDTRGQAGMLNRRLPFPAAGRGSPPDGRQRQREPAP